MYKHIYAHTHKHIQINHIIIYVFVYIHRCTCTTSYLLVGLTCLWCLVGYPKSLYYLFMMKQVLLIDLACMLSSANG